MQIIVEDAIKTAVLLISASRLLHVRNRVMLTEAIARSEPWEEKENNAPRGFKEWTDQSTRQHSGGCFTVVEGAKAQNTTAPRQM